MNPSFSKDLSEKYGEKRPSNALDLKNRDVVSKIEKEISKLNLYFSDKDELLIDLTRDKLEKNILADDEILYENISIFNIDSWNDICTKCNINLFTNYYKCSNCGSENQNRIHFFQ